MGKRVMVIDDSQEILELIEMILAEEGYEPLLHASGLQAPEEIKQARPDLLILDYMMGHEGAGGALLVQLRQDPATADLPIIICSAAARQLREIEGWLAAQGAAVVYKPFDLDELIATVRRMLGESADRGAPLSPPLPGVSEAIV